MNDPKERRCSSFLEIIRGSHTRKVAGFGLGDLDFTTVTAKTPRTQRLPIEWLAPRDQVGD